MNNILDPNNNAIHGRLFVERKTPPASGGSTYFEIVFQETEMKWNPNCPSGGIWTEVKRSYNLGNYFIKEHNIQSNEIKEYKSYE